MIQIHSSKQVQVTPKMAGDWLQHNIFARQRTMRPRHRDTQWTPPRFEAVDPQKDTMGEILLIRAGLMSLAEGIARQGYDPDVVTAEFAEMNKVLDQLGLVLDTDPRKSTRNGQAK